MPLFGGRKAADRAAAGMADAAVAGVRDVVARHPGPALLVAADGSVTAASPAAAPLTEAQVGAWWHDLFGWLRGPEARDLPFRTSRIETDRGLALIEWAAVGLPDNTVLLLGRDVTVERNLRDALAESRQRLRDFVDLACDFAWETSADGRFVYLSADSVLGHAVDGLLGRSADGLLAESGLDRSPFETRQPVAGISLALRRFDGSVALTVASARPLHDGDGVWSGARGVCRAAELES